MTNEEKVAIDTFTSFLLSDDTTFYLNGMAGCGKSTFIPKMLSAVLKNHNQLSSVMGIDLNKINSVILTATTNSASMNLKECFYRNKCEFPVDISFDTKFTVHQLLRKTVESFCEYSFSSYKSIFRRETGTVLIVIDEASYLNNKIILNFIRFNENLKQMDFSLRIKLLLVGDVFQLNVLDEKDVITADIIDSMVFLTGVKRVDVYSRLESVYQECFTAITTNQPIKIDQQNSDVSFFNKETFITKIIPNMDTVDGSIVVLSSTNTMAEHYKALSVDTVANVKSMTIHKAQGYGFDYVFIDLDGLKHFPYKKSIPSMLYVAITRAKKKVFFISSYPVPREFIQFV